MLRKKVLLLAALSALAIGGIAPIAQGDDTHPAAPCTWGVTKVASLHGSSGTITSLDLALGETVTIDYTIVVTRDCTSDHFDPFGEGGSAGVVDSYAGNLAEHLFLDSTALHESATFHYSRDVTASSCDSFDVVNTVDVLDGDPAHPFASTTNTIHVNVHCDGGCTLTQGYWKTHSQRGPAPYDDNWANLGPLQQDTSFYSSGKTWFELFWTPPKGGNAYIQLAHQYMAAYLNTLNGASTTAAVDSALAAAQAFFSSGATPSTSLSNSQANAVKALAGTLGSYNEGAIGPGHCDEDSHSDA